MFGLGELVNGLTIWTKLEKGMWKRGITLFFMYSVIFSILDALFVFGGWMSSASIPIFGGFAGTNFLLVWIFSFIWHIVAGFIVMIAWAIKGIKI
ncbi:MAG: hypothetical protein ACE5J9_03605 [Methanosarcinales archaeon]